jgi:fibronectin type 3 domain-containing protein
VTERDQTTRTAESRRTRRLSLVLAIVPALALLWGAGPAAAAPQAPVLNAFGASFTNSARTLNWSDSDLTVVGYHVFRGGAGCAGAVDITPGGLLAGTTTYTDTTTPADGALCYYVEASDGTSTADSNQETITYDTTGPSAPSVTAASPTNQAPVVDWNASSDGSGSGVHFYNVFRNGTQIATVFSPTTIFTDGTAPQNATSSYVVQAVDNLGNAGPMSSPVSVVYDTTAPSTPSITTPATTPTTTATAPALGWSASSDSGGSGLDHYRVNRNGSTVTSGGCANPTGTSCTDTDPAIAGGGTFTYVVRAVDAAGNASGASNSVQITYTTSGPAWSTNPLHATSPTNSLPDVSWTPPSDPLSLTYTLNRTGGPGAPATLCPGTASLDCTDSGAAADGTYTYTVTATDAANRTATSNPISVTVDTTAPSGGFVPNTPPGVVSPPLLPIANQLTVGATASDTGTGVSSVAFRYLAPGAPSWANAVTVNSAPGGNWLGTWNLVGLPDGIYTIGIVVTDKAGNRFGTPDNPAAQRPLVIDGTAPTGSVDVGFSDAPGSWVHAITQLSSSSANDATSGVSLINYQISGDGGATWQTVVQAHSGGTSPPWAASWDTTNKADGRYLLRAQIQDAAGNVGNGPGVNVRIDNTKPAAPTLSGPTGTVLSSPTLTWTPASDNGNPSDMSGLGGYQVFLTPPGSSTATKVFETRDTTVHSFTDTTATTVGTYKYQVRSFDVAGNTSAFSNTTTVVVDPSSVTAPQVPNTPQPIPTNHPPHLTWLPPSNFTVTQYQIYRDNAPLLKVGSNVLSYDDLSSLTDGLHTYTIQALNGTSGGTISKPIPFFVDTKAPAVATFTAQNNPDATVTLTWSPVSDASPSSGLLPLVIRRGPAGSPPATPADGTAACASPQPTATSCTDTGTVSGTTYSYAFFATDQAGNQTRLTSTVQALDTTPPDPPGPVTAVPIPGGVQLQWVPSPSKDVDHYLVRRQSGGIAPATAHDGFPSPDADIPPEVHQVTTTQLTNGSTYSFSVFAVDAAGNQSRPSSILAIHPGAGGKVDHTPPHKPTKFKAVIKGNLITLTWKRPPDKDYLSTSLYLNRSHKPRNSRDGVRLDGFTKQQKTTVPLLPLKVKPGKHFWLFLVARDKVGNLAKPVSVMLRRP